MTYHVSTTNIDSGYWFYLVCLIILFIITIIIQASVKSNYAKYSKVFSAKGLTGAQAAQMVLKAGGSSAGIGVTEKTLGDYYDPKSDTVYLSRDAFSNTSVAAIGVACHEAGHAVQYATEYGPVKLRMAMIPVCNFCSKFSFPLIIVGLILNAASVFFYYLAVIGVILYGIAILFQVVTLPVEFNASRRGLKAITELGILDSKEIVGAKKILTSAALTYVAAMAASILQLLRFASLLRRR